MFDNDFLTIANYVRLYYIKRSAEEFVQYRP